MTRAQGLAIILLGILALELMFNKWLAFLTIALVVFFILFREMVNMFYE